MDAIGRSDRDTIGRSNRHAAGRSDRDATGRSGRAQRCTRWVTTEPFRPEPQKREFSGSRTLIVHPEGQQVATGRGKRQHPASAAAALYATGDAPAYGNPGAPNGDATPNGGGAPNDDATP